MVNELTAEEIRAVLKLEPHATCGFVRVTFVSEKRIAAGGLSAPFADGRPAGSALYFMVTPEAPVRLHRIRNDQLYHYYLGDPIEVVMLHTDGTSDGPAQLHRLDLFDGDYLPRLNTLEKKIKTKQSPRCD